jgi:hypothetical protein
MNELAHRFFELWWDGETGRLEEFVSENLYVELKARDLLEIFDVLGKEYIALPSPTTSESGERR